MRRHHHHHHEHHRCWNRRRGPRPLVRRLFSWFGASILLSVLAASLVMWLVELAFPSEWSRDIARVAGHLSRRFAEVWDDPAARDRLATIIAEDFELNVVLETVDGTVVADVGEPCSGPHRYRMPLERDGETYGRIALCQPRRHPPAGLVKVFVVLVIMGFVLWMASGAIARRITLPLERVAAVADGIGHGDLGRRTGYADHRTAEVGVLAVAIDEMAERIQRQLGDQRELLAAVSHELRTPLGHLRVLIELARKRTGDAAKLEKAFGEMESEIAELDRLVGELLANSKLDFGVENPRRLDAKDLVRRALERAGLPVSLLDAEEGVHVEGDPTLLARALANLLDNAVRHGGGPTRVTVVRDGDRVVIGVEDQGPGVPEKDRERIFQPLQRGGSGNGSLGLGLALVARIAEAHGGTAWVEDGEGGGSRFSISLSSP